MLLLLLTLPVLCGTAASAAGPDWSAAPSSGDGASSSGDGARSRFYLEGEPGAVLKDTVAVTNGSPRARTYTLRGAGGGGQSGEWLAFAERKVTVPARTRAEVPFTMTVPDGAVPGDHPSAVLVGDGERTERVGVRLRVMGPALSALSVENVRVRESGDGAQIAYVLVNRGNTTLSPRLAVRADGLFGELMRRQERALNVELPPGARMPMREPWPSPPALDAADVSLRVTAEAGAKGTGHASYTAVPWGLFAALGTAAAAAAGGAWYVRARRRDDAEDSGEPTGELTEPTGALT